MPSGNHYLQLSRSFGIPLFAALLLHTVVVVLVFGSWQISAPMAVDPFDVPNYIRAEVVTVEKPKPAAKPVEKPKPKPQQVTKPKPQPKPKPTVPEVKPIIAPVEPAVADISVAPEVQPEPEIEPEPAAEPEPVIDDSESSFEDMLAGLAAEEQDINQQIDQIEQSQLRAAEIQAEVEDYIVAITRQIERKWSRPPELRLKDLAGVEARVLVEILPTGELQHVSITQGSGNTNYDQSVLRAIDKVRRFDVPQDPEVFEQGGFRRLNIIFRPEDLMKQ